MTRQVTSYIGDRVVLDAFNARAVVTSDKRACHVNLTKLPPRFIPIRLQGPSSIMKVNFAKVTVRMKLSADMLTPNDHSFLDHIRYHVD